jgi:hypothetical protein
MSTQVIQPVHPARPWFAWAALATASVMLVVALAIATSGSGSATRPEPSGASSSSVRLPYYPMRGSLPPAAPTIAPQDRPR